DYNYLKDLGIDTSALAALNAAGGGYGGGRASGGNSADGTPASAYSSVYNMARAMKTSRASDEQIYHFLMQQYEAGNIDYAEINYIVSALNQPSATTTGSDKVNTSAGFAGNTSGGNNINGATGN